MANNRTKVQAYTPAARVENFLKGYAEGKNKRIELELKQLEAQKANVSSAKDMMLIGMMQKLGILPSAGGASTTQPTQPSQGTQRQMLGGMVKAQIDSGRPPISIDPRLAKQDLGYGTPSSIYKSMGFDPDPLMYDVAKSNIDVEKMLTQEKALGPVRIEEAVNKEEALRAGIVETEVQKIKGKSGAETTEDTLRLITSSNVIGDTFLKRAVDLYDKYEVKPGMLSGIIDSLPGTELSEFKEAFHSSGIENAAQVAAIAIPSSRAVRIVDVFSKSGPGKFSTIESGANNMAATLQQAISKDAIANPEAYGLYGSVINRAEQANEIAKKAADMFKDKFLINVYNANPNLFSNDKEKARIAKLLGKENGSVDKVALAKSILGMEE